MIFFKKRAHTIQQKNFLGSDFRLTADVFQNESRATSITRGWEKISKQSFDRLLEHKKCL